MIPRTYHAWATALAGAGTAFSGYMSSVRYTSGVCAFAEPCPFFLGRPACYTGFALFATMLLVSLIGWARRSQSAWSPAANVILSLLGVAFAARLTVGDLLALAGGGRFGLGLPTCAYGLIFFAAMLALSVVALVKRGGARTPPRFEVRPS